MPQPFNYQRPLEFLPNVRVERASSTAGYNWGKTAQESNIVSLTQDLQDHLPQQELGLKDSIAERWIVSDDLEYPSNVFIKQREARALPGLLRNYGSALLGQRHMDQWGPYLGCIMKLLDTAREPSKGSLSVQVHPMPGFPGKPAKPEMWLGTGQIYIGWAKDMNAALLQQAILNQDLEKYMNAVSLSPDKPVMVPGGTVHAIRANSFIYEWSKAADREDHELGSLKQATIPLYDRTDGKCPRPGKEDLPGALKVMEHANGMKKKTDFFVAPKNIWRDESGNSIREIFATDVVHVWELTVKTEIEFDLCERGYPCFLEQGHLSVWHDNQKLDEMVRGAERLMPACLDKVRLRSEEKAPGCLYLWFRPMSGSR